MTKQINLNLTLHEKQGEAFQSKAREILYGGALGGGKAGDITIPVPTVSGWKSLGDIGVGDELFDARGKRCNVIAVTSAMYDRPCYEVKFSDGSSFVCDESHQWVTQTLKERQANTKRTASYRAKRRELRPWHGKGKRPDLVLANQLKRHEYLEPLKPKIRTTREISETLLDGVSKNHSVDVCGSIDCEEVELLVDPYVFGAWLGDGSLGQGCITTADVEIVQVAEAVGYGVRKRPSAKYGYGVLGLHSQLKQLGVFVHKHIPVEYLRASHFQRLSLLQGLMDTDGTATDRGHCEFTTTAPDLRDGVLELVRSLGIKASAKQGVAKLRGKEIGPKWRIKFVTELPVFRLPRKLNRQKREDFRGTHSRRYIVSCKKVASVPVRCIQVDSLDGTFLWGEEFVPTHNSHLLRIAAIAWCLEIPNLKVYLFRRTEPEIIATHIEGPQGLRALLSDLTQHGLVEIVKGEVRFHKTGSKIFLRHCKEPKDVWRYQSDEFHVLMIDEVTSFTEEMYRFLRTRVRMAGVELPEHHKESFPRIIVSGNPGNIGHSWVKRTWVDPSPPLQVWQADKDEGGMTRQYIPARLSDNPTLTTMSPDYEDQIKGLGSPELVQAMLEGDWNVVAGSYFPEFQRSTHVVEPHPIPEHWPRFRSMDWGSASPFAVHWWAISDGTDLHGAPYYPRGSMICYQEWYGASKPNKGLKLEIGEVADGIRQRDNTRYDLSTVSVKGGPADPSIHKQDGGPSIAEQFRKRGVIWHRGDNQRIAGWQELRNRFNGDSRSEERPTIYFFDTCRDSIRTIPELQHDSHNPNDLNTKSDDHCADSIRYAVMSRRIAKDAPDNPKQTTVQTATLDDLWEAHEEALHHYPTVRY